MENYTEAEALTREFFKRDKFVGLAGIKIEKLTREYAVIRAEIKDEHLNANGCVQGGMLYTAADFAFAVLGNFLHPATVTQSGHIQYIRPAYTSYITATATETERAGHNTVSEVIVRDDKDKIVCICHFSGFVKDIDRQEMMK